MLFSSIPFLYTFLPCVLILYFLVPGWLKNTVLLLSSLFFYAWGEPRFVVFMVIAIVQGYVFGLLAEKFRDRPKRAKLCLWASAVVSLGLLGYCKYADFFISGFNALTGLSLPLLHVALPIGISFYTFQILSYVIDVYRGDVTAQRNLIDLAAYVAMFPQLIAGPIVRYADIAPQLKHRTHTLAGAAYGARRFILGLSKKVLLANVLYELISAYKSAANVSVLFVWLYAAAYVLHLYFDFSGYSDMAIGLGRIFGFHFIENFNYPYISASVTEFWRRWHMSLGSWFRDYVYIPLGGNRVSKAKWFRNIFIVWLLTGLWHGAAWTFILWGLFFAVFLTAEKLWYGETLAQTRFLKHLYVLLLIAVSFVIFDAASVSDAFRTIGSLFGLGGLPRSDVLARYYFDSYSGVFLVAIVGATPLPAKIVRQFSEDGPGKKIRYGACSAAGPAGGGHRLSGRRVLQPVSVFPLLKEVPPCLKNGKTSSRWGSCPRLFWLLASGRRSSPPMRSPPVNAARWPKCRNCPQAAISPANSCPATRITPRTSSLCGSSSAP